jgi:regulatory protein
MMKKEISAEQARIKAETYCSRAEHCKSEVLAKLSQWGAPEESWEGILQHLEKERYIDESRYAHAFVRDKYRFSQWGTVKIRHALRLKNIPSECYAEAIEEIDSEEYLSALTDLLRRKLRSVKAASDYERNGKLIRYAASHGYGMNDILRCLKQIGCDEVDMD